MNPHPTAVADAYFAAIRARDAEALRALFAPDAELLSMGGVVHGNDAIAAFYATGAFTIEDLAPSVGAYVVDGSRVAVEIELRMNGRTTAVADVFTVEDGLIRRLGIYLGPGLG